MKYIYRQYLVNHKNIYDFVRKKTTEYFLIISLFDKTVTVGN